MTYMTAAHPATGPVALASGIGRILVSSTRLDHDVVPSLLSRAATELRLRAEIHRTRRQLSALSDRELDDIGLTRGDIDRAARKAAR
ncbi:DUF1127 domain-containing protein [Litorisediminicola beolgyonensis]|uniref:DUF1127 domain-containing protein n=1 Tax=Litorisediminicola beolgyonensis TaxID=1173614 RepID=A0ABW3ZNV4_9RHOB